jgi:hypothetical protein
MALPTIGSNPSYLEKIKIGGGYNSIPDGGIDIDATGYFAANGDATIDGNAQIGGDMTIGGSLDIAGTDKTWNVWLDATAAIFVNDANPAPVAATTAWANGNYNYLAFDQSTLEFIAFQAVFPEDYDGSSIDITFYWASGGSSGDVVWRARVGSFGDGENHAIVATDIGTVTDTFQGVNLIHKCTESGTPLNGTPGGLMLIGVDRHADNVNDTLNSDARLIGIRLSYS